MYKGIQIYRPRHFVNRDAHTNTPTLYDAEWIKEFIKLSKKVNDLVLLLPNSLHYRSDRHNIVSCSDITKQTIIEGPIAGHLQVANYSKNKDFFEEKWKVLTIYSQFLLYKNNTALVLFDKKVLETKKYTTHENDNVNYYDYGIDEFMLSSLYNYDFLKKKNNLFKFLLVSFI